MAALFFCFLLASRSNTFTPLTPPAERHLPERGEGRGGRGERGGGRGERGEGRGERGEGRGEGGEGGGERGGEGRGERGGGRVKYGLQCKYRSDTSQ